MCQMYLLSSVPCFFSLSLKVTLCPASLSLNVVTARPTYKLFPLLRVDIFALYMRFLAVYLSGRGQ